jgi:hypothetical protein
MPVRPADRGQRPWNKGLLIGQKRPLEPKHVWSIRVRLEIARSRRDLAIFNLAIDSKLRACDLVKLRSDDICSGAKVRHRATIVQKKTGLLQECIALLIKINSPPFLRNSIRFHEEGITACWFTERRSHHRLPN